MQERHLSENTRIYTGEYGSVWVKILVKQFPTFTALSYHPAERRMKAKACKLAPAGSFSVVRLTTEKGSYDIGESQFVRLASGEVRPVSEIRPGAALQNGVLKNIDGVISVETIFRDIWLHELIEADQQGYKLNLQERADKSADNYQRVIKVEPLGVQTCYRAIVDCATLDDPGPNCGHNLLAWPDGTSFGAGIFIF